MHSLNERETGILHSIVASYIETGEPVGSLALSRLDRSKLSAASIRNVMADLAEQGFLSQPHSSAGRVPTDRAILSYVKSLAVKVVAAELARIRSDLRRARSADERVERSSRLLTEFSRNVGIVAAIPAGQQTLKSIELVSLPDRRVLMVVITGDGAVHDRVISLDEPLTDNELTSIRNYVNQNFAGWTLADARRELERRMQRESAAYDAVLQRLMELHMRGLLDIALEAQVSLGGTSNLVGIDLHLTRESMRALFRTLEEKKKLMELLDRFIEASSGEPDVHVGLAEVNPALDRLSLIGVAVPMAGGATARVAVLGPQRMDYARAISAVVHVQQALLGLPD